jgi:molybdopterin converting factor small subunit
MSMVRIPPVLRAQTGGLKQVDASGDTVGTVIASLTATYPGLAPQLLDERGGLNRFVNVYLNDTDVRHLQELATPVDERDTLLLLPAMAGGAGTQGCPCGCTCGPRVTCACPGRASAG